ncbi:MAG TPA: type II secretion system F family protein [Eoetvoesiella sp.]
MFFWLSCLAAGLSLCLLCWLMLRPILLHTQSAKEYSDQLAMKLIWPWVLVFVPICTPFISWRTRHALVRSIQVAGLETVWQPQHVVAMQCLVFSLVAIMGALVSVVYFSFSLVNGLFPALLIAAVATWWPRRWLRDLGIKRQRLMLKEFPFLLDMTTLCVEAGLNLQGALQQAAHHGPAGPLRQELRHALADMRTGMPRLEALRQLSRRTGLAAVQQLVTALGQADHLGMSLGPLLRAQSEQRRSERFLRAEKLALEAPVKMLFPMVFCIFPCTFLVIGFPMAVKLMGAQF